MDELCKCAMEKDGGRLLALIFTPAVCRRLGLPHAAPRLLEILPTELRRKRQHAGVVSGGVRSSRERSFARSRGPLTARSFSASGSGSRVFLL